MSKTKATEKKRILIVSSIDISLLRFRGKLIELLIASGYEVLLVAPCYLPETEKSLKELGATALTVSMSRSGLSLKEDYRTYKDLKRIIHERQIDIVFPYTIKPVMYSSLAARQLGVPVVALVNGLGYIFSDGSLRQKILRKFIMPAYRYSIAKNKAIVFQNSDDQHYFRENRLMDKVMNSIVVAGSGVDLVEYSWREPRCSLNLRFCFVGRLLVDKGIQLFLNAASELKKKWPETEFHVYGEIQPNSPNSLSKFQLEKAVSDGNVIFHGRVNNICEELAKMDVIVYPSWYREGVPRSLLEALAVGLVLVVADAPGCRDTIRDGENGFLVPKKNLEILVDKMAHIIANSQIVYDMSAVSRKIAEEKFDVKKVNAHLLAIIQKAC